MKEAGESVREGNVMTKEETSERERKIERET